jgi:CRISPR/Cas system-associated protein Csx1
MREILKVDIDRCRLLLQLYCLGFQTELLKRFLGDQEFAKNECTIMLLVEDPSVTPRAKSQLTRIVNKHANRSDITLNAPTKLDTREKVLRERYTALFDDVRGWDLSNGLKLGTWKGQVHIDR